MPTCLPTVLRHCHRRAPGRLRANGKLRANANHKLLDALFLALRTGCGDTTRLAVPERMNVRSVPPELHNLLHDNDPGLAAGLLQGRDVRRRNVGGSGRTERPAWQSPYGPPPHRAHRGRWAPVPGVAWSRSALRRETLCDRCV
ncbi:DUF1062 domain-containing protein [Streptomyces sp. Tue6028]|uniref:DUF1062 domain-containing protein n=1 Tax=Streptomyces sp. Tue6028 TaxID=2036037 RepID=UPI003EB6B995